MHCSPGNTASAWSAGLCLGLGDESREDESLQLGGGREVKGIWDILISHLITAAWDFAFCSVELTLWVVIDWDASTSAFEDMGETYLPSTLPGFQWPWASIPRVGVVGEWASSLLGNEK